MGTLSQKQLVENVGQFAGFARARYVAAAGDDTAGTFNVDFTAEMQTIEAAIVHIVDSGNVQKTGYDITTSGAVVTIADGGSTTIANGDIFDVIVFGKPKA